MKRFTFKKIILAILLIALSIPILALPTSAHDPAWEIPTTAFINVAPDRIGVGQEAIVVFWLDRTPSGAVAANDIRMKGYQLHIDKPDGTDQVVTWDTVWDTTSSQYYLFTPDQIGKYNLTFVYPGQTYTWSGAYKGDIFKPSTSKTVTLTVTEEQLPKPILSYPMPTEYWTRPIEGQNTDWWTIASNWLGSGSPKFAGQFRKIQPDGIAPNSAHVMWTKPLENGGGLVGGTDTGINGTMFYSGLTYNIRFSNPIIMAGKLYYELPYGNRASGGGTVCVDLRTGQQLWWTNTTDAGAPSFGYLLNFEDPNQHGVLPQGLLLTNNFARAYDPQTGALTGWNMTNVPSGTAVIGPSGEHLRYTLTNIGTSTKPDYRLTEWNSSKLNQLTLGQIGAGNWFLNGFFNGSDSRMYDWNVSVPALPGLSAPSIISAHYGDLILGRSTSLVGSISPSSYGTPNPYTFWALSLKPGQEGQLLWIRNYTAPANDKTLLQGYVDYDARVFLMYIKEDLQWYGYSLDTGEIRWGPTPRPLSDFDYYEPDTTGVIAYGKFYYSNYGGTMYCYDDSTGKLLWSYGRGEEGNSTFSGLQTAWGYYPMQPTLVADGKIFTTYTEHSPNSPLYKGARVRVLNATDGTEVWTITGYGNTYGGLGSVAACADGYFVYSNRYDDQIYCFGKGPSELTVTAPDAGIELGKSVIIRGTITDTAAGTKQNEQAARFPNGIAAVSDESQSAWMEYVYMQKPKPTNVTGVPVSIDVIDANGNYRNIGTVTSDQSGMFTYAWKPDIEGSYTVFATFAGSESYWPSAAETSFFVDPTTTVAPSPLPETVQSTADLYFIPAVVAIIVAIAVGFAVTILILKRKP